MKDYKSCMVIGHRKIVPSKTAYVWQELRIKILSAIEDGYTHFICGFDEGVDLIFADIVAELKVEYPIQLEAVIPYRNRINTKDFDFQRMIDKCDAVGVYSEEYAPSCFMNRNRFMVQNSERVIAVYDGREKGGALATMRYAHALEKDTVLISI